MSVPTAQAIVDQTLAIAEARQSLVGQTIDISAWASNPGKRTLSTMRSRPKQGLFGLTLLTS